MEDFLQLQIVINLFLQHLSDFLLVVSRIFSLLGDEIFYFLFFPLLYWCIDSAMGMKIGAMLLLSNSLISGVKLLFHWPRPYWLDPHVTAFVHENTFGFPSGHSSNAASVWGVFAAQVKSNWFWLAAILTILMIGFSRLVLGVHFLVDVLGGWMIGLVLVLLFVRFEKSVAAWFSSLQYLQQWLTALISSILIILPTFFFSWINKGFLLPEAWSINAGTSLNPFDPSTAFSAGGTWAGFLGGFVWFGHYFGKLKTQVRFPVRILRYMIGMAGVVVLYKGLDMIFLDSTNTLGLVLRYLRYFLTGFWIAGLAPFIFRKLPGSLNEEKNTLQ